MNNNIEVSVTLGDETYSISRKTESADDAKDVTWLELMKDFLSILKSIGYILPYGFEDLVDEEEESMNQLINGQVKEVKK